MLSVLHNAMIGMFLPCNTPPTMYLPCDTTSSSDQVRGVGRSCKVGGGNFFYSDLGGLGACPPEIFCVFSCSDKLLVQSEAKILIELLNICG